MIRLIYYAILAYVVYAVYKFFQNLGRPRGTPRPKPRASEEMVKDESCDTYIPREEALREVIGGREYFFCSRECRNKYLDQRKKTPV